MRLISGITSGAVYFTFITLAATDHLRGFAPCAKRSCAYVTLLWLLILTLITYVVAKVCVTSNLPLNPVQGEFCCLWSSLLFAVFVLFLSVHLTKQRNVHRNNDWCLVRVQSMDTTRFNSEFFTDPNIRPLIYLIGAKLLTIACSFIPFFYVARNYFAVNDALRRDRINVSQCHLIAMLSARTVFGALANTNASSIVYVYKVMRPIVCAFGMNLLVLVALRHISRVSPPIFDAEFAAGWLIVCAYVILSLCLDAFSHVNALNASSLAVIKRPLAVTFAACIDHLIHLLFIIVYLSDVSNWKLFVFTFWFIGMSAMWQRLHWPTKETIFSRWKVIEL